MSAHILYFQLFLHLANLANATSLTFCLKNNSETIIRIKDLTKTHKKLKGPYDHHQ